MPTLYILRHAKSAWDQPGLRDHDRPLDSRGQLAACLMGAYMQQQGIEPELIVCSTATRTRQTLERALPYLPEGTEVVYSEDLYHASASGMARIAAELGYGLDSVMLVGHNPGSHFLALHLATSGDPAALDKLRAKFPTAGFAAIEFEQALADIEQGDGELVHFATPKSLV